MKVIKLAHGTKYAGLGVTFSWEPGYRKTFGVTVGKREFILEYGRGDGYDW